MADKKEYRSSVRSRRMIREAFLALLEEKEFKKITVTDIVNRADLNRSTFYAHYPDVNGVVEEIQDEIIQHNAELFKWSEYENVLTDPRPFLAGISKTLEENIGLYTKIGHTEDLHIRLDQYRTKIVDKIMEQGQIPEEVKQTPYFRVCIHFFVGGIMNTYQQWTQGSLNMTLDEISDAIAQLILHAKPDLPGAAAPEDLNS